METKIIYDDKYCDDKIKKINNGSLNINSFSEEERKAILKRSFYISIYGDAEKEAEIINHSCSKKDEDYNCLCHHCDNNF